MTIEGITPPSNIEAEQALLGALLVRNDLLFAMPQMKPEHFHEPVHSRLFSAICQMVERGYVANPVTLRQHFHTDPALVDIGGSAYLTKLVVSSVSVISIDDYIRIILELAHKRNIIENCWNTIKIASQPDSDMTAGEIAADLALASDTAADGATRYRILGEKEISEKIYERMKNKTFTEPFKTGLRKLDAAMGGGMYPGKLYGLMGRKKHGKTMLAGTISNSLQESGVSHGLFALEMGGEEIHQRSLASIIGCYESAFRSGFGESDGFLKKLADYAYRAKPGRIYVDAPGLKFNDLKTLLPAMIRKNKLSGFILDSWQLVKGKKDRQSEVDHLDDVAQWLAECCKKYGVWGLVTAQENQGENTRGGEGLRLACDQCYRIGKENVGSVFAWLDMVETRYTGWMGVGSKESPALVLSDNFTHFEELKSLTGEAAVENVPVQESLITD